MTDLFYRAFEDRFRGSRELIISRLEAYLPFLEPLKKISSHPLQALDLGCGRGEWLELMRDHGIQAIGLDIDEEMLKTCHKLDLTVFKTDVLDYLKKLPSNSLDMVSSFHVIEHISFDLLRQWVYEAHRILKPGGLLILETPNAENIVVGTLNFYIDPTHIKPLPADLTTFLMEFTGFDRIKIVYLHDKSHETALATAQKINLIDVLGGVSPNYGVIAQKPAGSEISSLFGDCFSIESGIRLETLARRYEEKFNTVYQEPSNLNIENNISLETLVRRYEEKLNTVCQKLNDLSEELHKLKKKTKCHEQENNTAYQKLSNLSEELHKLQKKTEHHEQKNNTAYQKQNNINQIIAKISQRSKKTTTYLLTLINLPALKNKFLKMAKISYQKQTNINQIIKQKIISLLIHTNTLQLFTITKKSSNSNSFKCSIAIDLLPLLPGGENGGAKVMILELIHNMSTLSKDTLFTILTLERTYDELTLLLKRDNVECVCVEKTPYNIAANLLFCPFPSSNYSHIDAPIVSIIYDLQYLYYPSFFNSNERYQRNGNFLSACSSAHHLICISDYVRNTIIENAASVPPEKITTIPCPIPNRQASKKDYAKNYNLLTSLHLISEQFLLYPANFWKHKNHEILLIAFSMYCHENPNSNLKLVLTGHPCERRAFFKDNVLKMGLAERVVFLDYVDNETLSILMSSCLALIFPSLYEGFGMPIIEAMTCEKPILCSNVTSLPEVAGDAALLFDPRKPNEIVNAIKQIESSKELCDQLIEKGRKRLLSFPTSQQIALHYLDIFSNVLQETMDLK